MRLPFLFLGLWMAFPAHAEYRLFMLQVQNDKGEVVRQFKSNLDPDQYRGYYHIAQNERLIYVETWMCRGNTSHMKSFCLSPKELAAQEKEREPASTDQGPDSPPQTP